MAQSLVVSVPGDDGPADPTGIVFNGSNSFVVNDGQGHSGASAFIFASEDGTISGWSPTVPLPPPSTVAHVAVNNSAEGAVYKGLAIGTSSGSQFIYATDFHNNHIDVFNSTFGAVTPAGTFTDPNIPAGFAPFGIQNIGNELFVTYAKQDGAGHDDVAGPGNGFVDVYDTSGHLLQHLIAGGALNSPWGLAMAPANFGQVSNDLLVGNFGDGEIHAYDPTTGALLGTISDKNGNPLVEDGLWALQFGNGLFGQFDECPVLHLRTRWRKPRPVRQHYRRARAGLDRWLPWRRCGVAWTGLHLRRGDVSVVLAGENDARLTSQRHCGQCVECWGVVRCVSCTAALLLFVFRVLAQLDPMRQRVTDTLVRPRHRDQRAPENSFAQLHFQLQVMGRARRVFGPQVAAHPSAQPSLVIARPIEQRFQLPLDLHFHVAVLLHRQRDRQIVLVRMDMPLPWAR